jgi:Transposase DDE domain
LQKRNRKGFHENYHIQIMKPYDPDYTIAQCLRLEDGDLLVIATQTAPKSAIRDYAQRWGIETLFGIFKTRGFCLESTHLNDPKRLSTLIALLSLALCWVVLMEEWLHQSQPLKVKTHGRRAKSLFRLGFDSLRNIVVNLDQKFEQFLLAIRLLSCT